MFAQKKKVMMMRQAAPSGGTPVTGLTWNLGKQITSSGSINSVSYAASTLRIEPVRNKVRRTGLAEDDGATINMFLHEYTSYNTGLSSSGWLKRTQMYVGGDPVTLDSRTTYVAFSFAFGSTSGRGMREEIIDAAFGAEWV